VSLASHRAAWPHTSPVEQLEEIVGTIIWSNLHDDFARRAAYVVSSEYARLRPPERAAIEVKRKALLDLVEKVVREGVAERKFNTDEPREAARAIVTLAQSTVGVEREINRSLEDIIELYQGFGRAVHSYGEVAGSRRRACRAPPSRATPSRRRVLACLLGELALDDRQHVGGYAHKRQPAGGAGHHVLGEVAGTAPSISRAVGRPNRSGRRPLGRQGRGAAASTRRARAARRGPTPARPAPIDGGQLVRANCLDRCAHA
jgi:hypothetical protein